MPITFLQLEFQKSTLWTPCNRLHKTSSNILERMDPPPAKYLRGQYLTLNVSYSPILAVIFNGLRWFHCGTGIQMVKSLGLLKGLPGPIQYMLSPQVDQKEMNWTEPKYGVAAEVDPPAMSARYGQELSWSTSVFMRKNYLKSTWRKTNKALRLVTNIWNCHLHL